MWIGDICGEKLQKVPKSRTCLCHGLSPPPNPYKLSHCPANGTQRPGELDVGAQAPEDTTPARRHTCTAGSGGPRWVMGQPGADTGAGASRQHSAGADGGSDGADLGSRPLREEPSRSHPPRPWTPRAELWGLPELWGRGWMHHMLSQAEGEKAGRGSLRSSPFC